MIKKADIILFIFLIVLGIGTSIFIIANDKSGGSVTISVDNKVYGTYSLNTDKTISIDKGSHHNIVVIKDGKVTMTKSSCHNQVCVNHRAIDSTSESIVCLPNKVLIEITENNKKEDFDAISN